MYDAVHKNHSDRERAGQNVKVLGNSTLLKEMNVPDNRVIQRADQYIPNGDREPHLHLHDGGVTYTDVGHRHTTIVSGQHIVKSSILRVLDELKGSDSPNAQPIIDYLLKIYDIKGEDPDKEREDDLRFKLAEMGSMEVKGEILSVDGEITNREQLFRHEDKINEQYERHQEFLKRETEVPDVIEIRTSSG